MKMLLPMVLGSVLTGVCSAGYDLEPLTYDSKVWSQPTEKFVQAFPELNWKNGQLDSVTSASDLTLWGQAIERVVIAKGDNELADHIRFTILGRTSASTTSAQNFTLKAAKWKQALDKTLGQVGKRVPAIKQDANTISKIAWKTDSSVIILSASRGEIPLGIDLSIFETKSGIASLDSTIKKSATEKETDTDKPDRNTGGGGSNWVAKVSNRKTSYLSRSSFKKRNVSGKEDYYMLYFSASW